MPWAGRLQAAGLLNTVHTVNQGTRQAGGDGTGLIVVVLLHRAPVLGYRPQAGPDGKWSNGRKDCIYTPLF